MTTLAAAKDLFDLSEGGSDDDYNVYNYMVLTARAKPHALSGFLPLSTLTEPLGCRSCANTPTL